MAASIQLCARCNANIPTYEIPSLLSTLHALRSLHIPCIHKTIQIQENIDSWLLRLSDYEKEIARMETSLDEMKRKRDEIQAYINTRKSLLSPVRKLPMEVLTQIFDFYYVDVGYGLSVKSTPGSRIVAPSLTLSHVCTFWRKVTRSQPSLWSSMSLDLRQCRFKQRQLCHLVKCYLRRSKGSLLRLRLVAFDLEPDDHGQFMLRYASVGNGRHTIFRMLLKQRLRWKEVALDLHNSFYEVVIQDGDSGPSAPPRYPSLQALKLDWSPSSTPVSFNPRGFLQSLVADSPNLRNLELPNFEIEEDDEDFIAFLPFKFARITSLTLSGAYNNRTIEDALESCSSLEHLSIVLSCVDENDEDTFDMEPVAFSDSLKSLTIVSDSADSLSLVLSGLRLPSLTTLDITLDSCDGKELAEGRCLMHSFKIMLDRSQELSHFKFSTGDTLSADKILDILSWMPKLTHLSLEMDFACLTDKLFPTLTLPSKAGSFSRQTCSEKGVAVSKLPLLPLLASFDFSITELYSCKTSNSLPDVGVILNMILSRRQGSICCHTNSIVMSELSHFTLSVPTRLCSPSERAWAERMRSTFGQGLRLHEKQMRQGLSWNCLLDLGEL